jgi:hypothetical protein
MKEVKEELDVAKGIKTRAQEKFDFLRLNRLPDLMDEEGISNVTIDDVGRVTLTSDVYASIPAAKRQDAYDWFKNNGHGDLIKETVNAGTFKAFAKGCIKKGEELPEHLFKITPFSRASITKTK